MDNNIKIRKAISSDLDQIVSVLLDFYNMDNSNEAKHALESELTKDYNYIVALEKNKIIGLVTWIMHGLPKHGLFELDRICVISGSRGRGIGKKLVKWLIDDAKKWYKDRGAHIRKLYILTHEENLVAQNFYQNIGFDHETTLKDHYYSGKNERVYSLFFNDLIH
tara:strand:+ start:13986 stop:14480 length:495 start_codon:yes stop_codon:yes gene_type:complete